ncbi:MAG: serine hydrolase domain-containing protein [Pseudomonadota bacterium]
MKLRFLRLAGATASAGHTGATALVRIMAVLGALAWASSAWAQEPWRVHLGPFVDGLVTTILDQDAVAGAVVQVVTGDEVLISRGYRLADVRTGRSMSATGDIVPLASVTKVFTSLAILQLAEVGRLSLDDPIAQYLPGLDLDQPHGAITIAHLLSHTAGLEERYSGYLATHPDLVGAPAISQISAVLPRQIRPPGEVIAYSNASYVLLGWIVAHLSGQTYEDYVGAHILSPLGIEAASFVLQQDGASDSWRGGASPFHIWDAGRYMAVDAPPLPAIHGPSGGLALTAEGMGRVLQALLREGDHGGAPGLSEGVIARMHQTAWPGRPDLSGRTMAYWTEDWAGHDVYYHGGSHFGFHTMMVLVPTLDLGFFVAANGPSGSALTGLPRRALREVIAPGERAAAPRAACDAPCLAEYTGRFMTTRRNETGFDRLQPFGLRTMEVHTTAEGELVLSGLGYARRFHPVGADLFETPEADAFLGFRRDPNGRVVGSFLNAGMHSFDRLGFWHTAASVRSGVAAAIVGAALCLLAGILSRRASLHALRSARVSDIVRAGGVPAILGVFWLGTLAVATVLVLALLDGRDLSGVPTPGPLLWGLTSIFAVAATSVVWAGVWLVRAGGASAAGAAPRLLVLAALPLLSWALFAAWMWNLPTAAPNW